MEGWLVLETVAKTTAASAQTRGSHSDVVTRLRAIVYLLLPLSHLLASHTLLDLPRSILCHEFLKFDLKRTASRMWVNYIFRQFRGSFEPLGFENEPQLPENDSRNILDLIFTV